MGGKVVDERGRPIAGARVLPSLEINDSEEVSAAVTDAQGVLRSDALPSSALGAKPARPIDLLISHPDHVTAGARVPAEAAHAGKLVLTLKQGTTLEGSVVGPDGQPVAGASVLIEQALERRLLNRTVTDASGQFHFGRLVDPQRRSIVLTVKAPGLAASVRRVLLTPSNSIPRQTIQLTRRVPLKGRVVDSRGNLVAGAFLQSSIHGTKGLEWIALSDDQGGFEWPDAPTAGSIMIDVYKPAFAEALERLLDVSTREITITLHRPLHLHGRVTDAVTVQPIERFNLIPGTGPIVAGGGVQWGTGLGDAHHVNGRFDLRGLFVDQGANRAIRIEAEGYLPSELVGFRDDAEEVAHDFKLNRARTITGIVRGRDGKPVAGAEVTLRNSDKPSTTKTGPDGRYRFGGQDKPDAVVVVHQSGFAVRPYDEVAASFDVTLAPWGRIEGVLKVGKNLAPNQKVCAWQNSSLYGWVWYETKTDDRGRFVLERVRPGAITVCRAVGFSDHEGWVPSNTVFADVGPGQTVRLVIGDIGRPVTGRLKIPQGFRLADLVSGECKLAAIRHEPRKPDDFPDYMIDQKNAWFEHFYKTPEGKRLYQEKREYAVEFGAGGAFRIEDVPAGRYILTLPFRGRAIDEEWELRAFAESDVSVPAIPGGRSDEPLEVGTIRLDVYRLHEPKVGDQIRVPLRNAADGRPLDLAALRGKFVLLDFWATWRADTMANISALKETYAAFGRDPRFVMISLNLDLEPETPRRYAAYRGMQWEQRYLGWKGESPDPIAAAFGVETTGRPRRLPPQVMLIGPDGRLVARDLKGPEIKQAVGQALGSP